MPLLAHGELGTGYLQMQGSSTSRSTMSAVSMCLVTLWPEHPPTPRLPSNTFRHRIFLGPPNTLPNLCSPQLLPQACFPHYTTHCSERSPLQLGPQGGPIARGQSQPADQECSRPSGQAQPTISTTARWSRGQAPTPHCLPWFILLECLLPGLSTIWPTLRSLQASGNVADHVSASTCCGWLTSLSVP